MENNIERISDGGFSRDEYIEHPERYKSLFSTKVHLLVLLAKLSMRLLYLVLETKKFFKQNHNFNNTNLTSNCGSVIRSHVYPFLQILFTVELFVVSFLMQAAYT